MNDIERLEQEVMEMNDFNVYTIFNHIKDLPELQTKFSSKEKTYKICISIFAIKQVIYEKVMLLW